MKKINLILAYIVVTILATMSIASAISLVTPADNAVISGNSVVLNASGTNLVNCSFYAKSSSTANSTWTLLGTFNNESTTSVNGTFNSHVLEDSNDYVFNATCTNSSNSVFSDINTGITVDNTVPSTPTSLSPATNTIDTDGTVTFSANIIDANTTKCILYFSENNPGRSSYTMTQTPGTSTCTLRLNDIPEQTYTWYVVASDGTNLSSGSSSNIIQIDKKTSSGGVSILKYYEKHGKVIRKSGKTFTIIGNEGLNTSIMGLPLWMIIALAIVVFVIYKAYKK